MLTGELTNINFGGHPLAIPDDQQPAIKGLIGKFIDATAQAGNITTTVYAGGGPTLSRNLLHRGQVARVVASGDVFPGKDVAILKIDARNLPVLSLGDDAAMQTGDAVHAIGYPGDATFDPTQISDTVSADSTMSDGIVSNRLQSSKANYQIVENHRHQSQQRRRAAGQRPGTGDRPHHRIRRFDRAEEWRQRGEVLLRRAELGHQ